MENKEVQLNLREKNYKKYVEVMSHRKLFNKTDVKFSWYYYFE